MLQKLLPNALTLLRLVAGLCLPFLDEFWWLPLVVFAAVSDVLDGWLSRKWNGASTLGQLLDPVADKVFVAAALYSLWQIGWMTLTELAWLASRDLAVLGLTGLAAASTRLTTHDLKPRWSGKLATAAQFVALAVLIYQREPMPQVVLWAGALSFVSALDYALAARLAWRRRKNS